MGLKNHRIIELICENPRRVSVFEEHEIDYCRDGDSSLLNLCLEMGLNVRQIEQQLLDCDQDPFEHLDLALHGESASSLVDYLERVCHPRLKANTARISSLLGRVALVYEKCNPELRKVQTAFEQLRQDLQCHLLKEEQIVFDWIRHRETGTSAAEAAPFGAMEAEHEDLLAAFARLRELTRNYQPPEYACGSFRVMLSELAQLESDLRQFADLEDHVLFPRAEQLSPSCAV